MSKNKAEDFIRESLQLARRAQELLKTARGLTKRVAQLQREAEVALKRGHTRKATKARKRAKRKER